MISVQSIEVFLSAFHEYVARNVEHFQAHPAARVSEFWVEHFKDRQNFPSASDFLAFRRENFLYGIGYTGPAAIDRKKAEFSETVLSITLFTPPEFISGLREPVLGAPLVFPFGNTHFSSSFVLNAGTAWRIKSLNDRFGKNGKIHVAEIGAGWGACATQLLQVSEIESYTIVDLPENLCLSSTYLKHFNEKLDAQFVECVGSAVLVPKSGLIFALPPAIDRLKGPYDLIINTMSFQEMDLETVDTYLNWAHSALAPGGLLISFNSHDKSGIHKASQYLHNGLKLVHMAPFRKVPTGWFNTIPYEMVFRREESSISKDFSGGFARVRAKVLVGSLEGQVELEHLQKEAVGLSVEAINLIKTRDVSKLQNHIARILDCPVGKAQKSRRLSQILRRMFS